MHRPALPGRWATVEGPGGVKRGPGRAGLGLPRLWVRWGGGGGGYACELAHGPRQTVGPVAHPFAAPLNPVCLWTRFGMRRCDRIACGTIERCFVAFIWCFSDTAKISTAQPQISNDRSS